LLPNSETGKQSDTGFQTNEQTKPPPAQNADGGSLYLFTSRCTIKNHAGREVPALHFPWELHPRPLIFRQHHDIIIDTSISYKNCPIQPSSWETVSWELDLKNVSKYRILVLKPEISFRTKQNKNTVDTRFSRIYGVPDL